ncbi:uncharacterized protein [Antedon mediterranea]|uniref:uncharacterized protein isoform X2 n=1 Tax=Antedon mediterranea TaxID=105859 RepID=UPI003AF6EC30
MYVLTFFMVVFSLTNAFVLSTELSSPEFCPINCICAFDFNISTISCHKLMMIPSNLADVGPPFTTSINMSFNEVSAVNRGDFSGLHQLKSFNISNNGIEFFQDNVFDGLVNLRFLNLSYNNIKSIFGGIFQQMTQLTTLNLSHNYLKVLMNDAFLGLNELKTLYIHNNRIRYIEGDTVETLPNLKRVSIGANSGHCDCSWIRLTSRLEFYDIIVIDQDFYSGCENVSLCREYFTSQHSSLITSTLASVTGPADTLTESNDVIKTNGDKTAFSMFSMVHLEVKDGILFCNGSSTLLPISSSVAQEYIIQYDRAIWNRINEIKDEKTRGIIGRAFHRQMSAFIKTYFELEPSFSPRPTNYTDESLNATDSRQHIVIEETSMIIVAASIPIIAFIAIYFTLQYVHEVRKDTGYVEISPGKNSTQNQENVNNSSSTMPCCCLSCLNAITTKLVVRKNYVEQTEDDHGGRFRKIHEGAKIEIDKNKRETKPIRKLSMISSLRKLSFAQKRKEEEDNSEEILYSLAGNDSEPEYCKPIPRSGTVMYSSDEASERSWDETAMLNTNANHSSACSDPNDTFFKEIELSDY